MFPAQFNLSSLNGKNGFVLNGINSSDASGSGSSVSGAGDINDDRIDDIVISVNGELCGNECTGQGYVVFGSRAAFPAQIDLSSLNGKDGFMFNGWSGGSVSGAGDFNGDGIADIIIGGLYALNGVGQSYVVFGSRAAFPAQIDLSSLNGKDGFTMNGINQGDFSGSSVSGVGDVNGDGLSDIIIGAPGALNNAGQSYIVFGSRAAFPAQIDLSSLNGTNGFTVNGVNSEDSSGSAVSGAGDFNGDGIADVIIGAFGALNGAGQSYIVFGSRAAFPAQIDLSSLNGKNGFAINGINGGSLNNGDLSGSLVSGAGDVNGDGIADVIIGAPYALNRTGQSYVVFGSKGTFLANFNLTNLNGINGFALNGYEYESNSGFSASGAGDFNGDGTADVVIGAPTEFNGAGQSYVVFGSNASNYIEDINF